MKIAMYNLTTTCRFGGVETFVWAISRELAARGEEVHIIGGRGTIRQDIPGVKIILFPFWARNRIPDLGTRFRKLLERWSMGIVAASAMIKEKYDIFHIHKPYDLPFGRWIKKRSGARLILGSHGTDFFPGDQWFSRGVDAIVSCSQFNAGQITRRYGLHPTVIYNGVDPGVFRPLPADIEVLRKFSIIPGKEQILIYAGRLIGLKGVGDLLRAAAQLKERFSLRLFIIGEGEARRRLETLSGALNLNDRVIFTGYIPNQDLPRYYSISDLAVFPSIADETFGVAICEAMACGKAVVSTQVGGIPELIEDGVSGLLAQPKDDADLAIRMAYLLENDGLRRSMGAKGAERARTLFTWDKVADRLLRVYREVWVKGAKVEVVPLAYRREEDRK